MISRDDRANAIRFLSMDAVQEANSGHPGMPMGMATIAEVLWHDFLAHNPSNPHWFNRDRFILSNGHGSMLQYALLHLTGYDLTIDDLKHFRKLHSKTPGHPEYRETPGIETTTGPLGQGLGNAVGMAIAERHLAALFNRPDYSIVDHFTYCFVGDGDLMEGISHEVASLAGTLGLGKLIVFYDDNGISIDGNVEGWFTDNTPLRFKAYNWHVIENVNGHKSEDIYKAIQTAQTITDKPTIICCKTTIGWGSPNLAGKASTHGAPLGASEIIAVRDRLTWTHEPFVIPSEVYSSWNAKERGAEFEQTWQKLFNAYAKAYPEIAAEFMRRMQGELVPNWEQTTNEFIQALNEDNKAIATRKASQISLNQYARLLPEMMGGSADLTESNCTNWQDMSIFSRNNPAGRYIHYGVREFGMSAIMNGLAVHQGILPFGGTFLTFSDYARNAVRLAALMRIRVIYVYTHDSIGLGEDGPTHQPVEHLPSLRLIPQLSTWRPCDNVETAVAWRKAIEHQGPTCLLFSRQNLPHFTRTSQQLKNVEHGGYILRDIEDRTPDVILIATGSEVALCVEAAEVLKTQDIGARVVSIPSTDVYLAQPETYRQEVLPEHISARVAVEAASSLYWYAFVGPHGKVVGVDRFGASAPAKDVYADCGLTVEHVVIAAKETIYSAAIAEKAQHAKCA